MAARDASASCGTIVNVSGGGASLQNAINAIPGNVASDYCIYADSGPVYSQILVSSKTFSGLVARIIISSGTGIPTIASGTGGAFIDVKNDSVTIAGFNIVPGNAMNWGVLVSSSFVTVSSVTIVDTATYIGNAGIYVSSSVGTIVSSVTVSLTAANAEALVLGSSYSIVTASTFTLSGAATNGLAAVRVTGSTNTIKDCYIAGNTQNGLLLQGTSANTIKTTTMTTLATGLPYAALKVDGSLGTTVAQSIAFSTSGASGGFFTNGAVFSTLSQSTFTARGSPNVWGINLNGSSYNSLTGVYVANPLGDALYLSAGASFNTITQSSMTTSAAAYWAVDILNSPSNVITNSWVLSQGGGVTFQSGANFNTIQLTTVTATGNAALDIDTISGNNLAQNLYLYVPNYSALYVGYGATQNTVSQSSVVSNSVLFPAALFTQGASTNTITQSIIRSGGADALQMTAAAGYNTVSFSTISAGTLGFSAVDLQQSSGNLITQSYVDAGAASTGVYILGGYGNSVALSTVSANTAMGAAVLLNATSSNSFTSDLISNSSGPAAWLAGASSNQFSQTTILASTASSPSLGLDAAVSLTNGSSSNTFFGGRISNSLGTALYLNTGSNGNAVSQSSVTAGGTGNAAFLFNASSNSLSNDLFGNGGGIALFSNSNYNTVSFSTVAVNNVNSQAVYVNNSASNLVSQSKLSNNGYVAYLTSGANFNTINQSTLTSVGNNGSAPALAVLQSSSNTVLASYIQGQTAVVSSAVWVNASTGTTISSSTIIAPNAQSAGVRLDGGSVNLFLAQDIVKGGSSVAGVLLDAGNSGVLSLSSVSVQGSRYGVSIAGQSQGAVLAVSSVSFSSLAAGATAIEFLGGTFVSTFSLASFADATIAVNVDGTALGSGSRVTMRYDSGGRTGPSYENDPGGYIDWPDGPVAMTTAPAAGAYVNSFGGVFGVVLGSATSVSVGVQRRSDGNYWDGGSGFNSGSQMLFAANLSTTGAWSYVSGVLAAALTNNTSYFVYAQAANSFVTQTPPSVTTFAFDVTVPTVFISSPVLNSTYSFFPSVAGTALDSGGVASIGVAISSGPGFTTYWNGGSWVSSITYNAATGTATWTFSGVPTGANLVSGTTYQLQARAIDLAGNVNVTFSTFSYQNSSGCVSVPGQFATIQGAINAAPPSLTADYCVAIASGSYAEQVTIQGVATNGFKIAIFSQGLGAPLISPPVGSTAAFVVLNDSVTIKDVFIQPANAMTFGIFVSSSFASISSVTVQDLASKISSAGVVLAGNSATLSSSTFLMGGAPALAIAGNSAVVSSGTFSANSGVAAARIDGGSSNQLKSSFVSNTFNGAPGLLISGNAVFNTVTLSTVTGSSGNNCLAGALAIVSASSNVLTNDYVSGPFGNGVYMNGASYNTVSQSTAVASGTTGCGAVDAAYMGGSPASSYNLVTQSRLMTVGSGNGLYFDLSASYNTVQLSTMTSDLAGGYAATFTNIADHNLITQSYLAAAGPTTAVNMGCGGSYNTVSQSTIVSSQPNPTIMVSDSSSTLVQDFVVNNGTGDAVNIGTNGGCVGDYSTVSLSTLTSLGAALRFSTVLGASVQGSVLQGSTGAFVAGSTGTVVAYSSLTAVGSGAALWATAGPKDLTISSSVLLGLGGTGILIGSGGSGTILLSSVVVRGAGTGVSIAAQAAGASLIVSSLTFSGLPAGATALSLAGGFVSTLSAVGFLDATLGVNVNGVGLSGSGRITMRGDYGPRTGPAFEVDPAGRVDWPDGPIALATAPANGVYLSSAPVIQGTVVASTGVAIGVAVQQLTDGQYWNGTSAFNQASPVFNAATVLGSSSWSYVSSLNLTNGASYFIFVQATDSAGRVQNPPAKTTIFFDNAAPAVFISSPVANSTYSFFPSLAGTANDGSGVQQVSVGISSGPGFTTYWNGSSWVAGPFFSVATGTAAWSYASVPSGASLVAGTTYQVTAKAVDLAGNFATVQSSFVYLGAAPGCATSANAVAGVSTIQSAVNAAPNSLSGNHCVFVASGTYAEQVVVQNVVTNGYRIVISSSGTALPLIAPPPGATAAFVIKNASVSLSGVFIQSTVNVIPYGVLAGSASVSISSVVIQDPLGKITVADVQVSSFSSISYSSFTAANGKALIVSGSSTTVSFSTMAANIGQPTVVLNGGGVALLQSYVSNSGGAGLAITGGPAVTIAASTVSGAGLGGALIVSAGSGHVLTGSAVYGSTAVLVNGGAGLSIDGFLSGGLRAAGGAAVTATAPLGLRGDLVVNASSFSAGAFNHAIGGNLALGPGTFAAQGGTITFDGSLGSFQSVSAPGAAFNGLVVGASSVSFAASFSATTLIDGLAGSTVAFAGGITATVGDLEVHGGAGAGAISLIPAVPATSWSMNLVSISSVTGAFVANSNASGGLTIQVNDGTSLDGGGNSNWNFKPFLVILAPGETFTPGVGKSGTPSAQTAGVPFSVTVMAVSASSNPVASSSFPVTLAPADPYVGPQTQALVAGATTFLMALRAAEPAGAPSTLSAGSAATAVPMNPGPYAKLQLLMASQAPAPGSPSGFTGTPDAQVVKVPVSSITIRAVDAFNNLVPSVTDVVAITTTTSSSATITSTPQALVSGAFTFGNAVVFFTTGTFTITSSDTAGSFPNGVGKPFAVTLPSLSSPTVTLNIANSTVTTLGGGLYGFAFDGAAVSKVWISLKSFAGGTYFDWSASAFSSAIPVFATATLNPPAVPATNWSQALADSALTDGTSYFVEMRAFNPSNFATIGYATFTFRSSLLSFGAGDGQGSAAVVPASAAGCQALTVAVTYTPGSQGVGPGGAVALRLPAGWTHPISPSGANPPPIGYVNVASTSPALGSAAVLVNPPTLSSVTLGTDWIVVTSSVAAFAPGQQIVFTYSGFPPFGPTGRGAQTFDLREQGGPSGSLLTISTPPVLGLTAGTTVYLSFADFNPISLGPLQNSPTIQLQLNDVCGNAVALPAPVSSTLTAGNFTSSGFSIDATAKFFAAGGGATLYDTFPASSSLSKGFYFQTSTAGVSYEFVQATATLSGALVATSRYVAVLASSLTLSAVSIDTGTAVAGSTSAAFAAGGSAAAAATVRFTANYAGLPWEVVISTDGAAFYPVIYRAGGATTAGPLSVPWNGVSQLSSLAQFAAPGTYKVRIKVGDGSVQDVSLEAKLQPSGSIYGNLGASGAGAFVSASGPGVSYANVAQASATGYFQIFGLASGSSYNLFASTGVSALGQIVTLTTAAYNVTASLAGGNAGPLAFPATSFLRVSVTIPVPAPHDFAGSVFAHNANYTATAFGSLHYFAGLASSDNGAQTFGQTASTWTVIVVPPGVYTLEIGLPDVQLSTSVAGVSVAAGAVVDVPLALSRKVNVSGYAVLAGTSTFGNWVSVEASRLGQGAPSVFGGAFVPPAPASSAPFTLFGLDAGSWTLTARSFGFTASSVSVLVGTADLSGVTMTLGQGAVISGSVIVQGDTGQVFQCFSPAGCPPGTYDLSIQAYNPQTYAYGYTQVRLSTSASSASSAFTISGLDPGTYLVRSFLQGFSMSPSVGLSVAAATYTLAGSTLTLAADNARLSLSLLLPPLPGGVCRSTSDFKAVGFSILGPNASLATGDITTLTPNALGGASYGSATSGAVETYFCSSMTLFSPPAGGGFYRFTAMYGPTGAYLAKDIPLVNGSTIAFTMDLSQSTYPVSGVASLSGNVSFPQPGGFSVVVSSLAGALANAPTTAYCLLSSSNPVAASALHLELLPLDRSGQAPGALSPAPSSAPGACASIPLSPAAPLVGYVSSIGRDGSFVFAGVPPGSYVLRANADLDLNPADGAEIAAAQALVQVSSSVGGLQVKLGQGVEVQGTVSLPPGVVSNRPIAVVLQDSKGTAVAATSLNFQNTNSLSYAFDLVPDGRYAIAAQDQGFPKAYAAKPLAVTVAGASLTGQNLTLVAGGTIKATLAVQQARSDGTSQFVLVSRQNANLLPQGFTIDAIANPWFIGGFFLADSACGPGGCAAMIDDNGQIAIEDVLPGTYDVEFNAPNDPNAIAQGGVHLVPTVKSGVTLASGQTMDLGTVNIPAAVTLSGKVTDLVTSTPIANIMIQARPSVKVPGQSTGRSQDAQIFTGRDGKYSLAGLDPAVRFYDVVAVSRDGENQGDIEPPYEQKIIPSVDIKSTSTLDFALTPASFSVSGQAVSATGEALQSAFSQGGGPAPGAIVFLQKNGVVPTANPIADIVFFTDPSGRFNIPSLTIGTYKLVVTALGYASVSQLVTIGTASVNVGLVTLRSGATLSGALRKADGSAPSEDEVHTVIGATPDLSEFLFGSTTRDTATRSITGYTVSGFKANTHYRLLLITSGDELISPNEGADIVFVSSSQALTQDIVLRHSRPYVLAKTHRDGAGFDIDMQPSQPLRARTADDDDLTLILTTVSAQGSLSGATMASSRMKVSAVYTPGVNESSFTLHFRAYSSQKDPDSIDAVNPEFLEESTVTFFVGIDGLHRNSINNVLGGTLLVEGDTGRVTLPPGAFAVDASSSVDITLQKSADNLARGKKGSAVTAAEANVRALRYSPSAYPAPLLQAMAALPAGVNPFSGFYDILLPLGVRAALSKPVPMTVAYSTDTDPSTLNLYWYNAAANAYVLQQDVTGAKPVIDTVNHTVTINVNHFSTFVLFNTGVAVISGATFAGGEIEAFNFPNPFDLSVKTVTAIHPGSGAPAQTVRGTMIRFSLPADVSGDGSIRIFNVAGEKVRSIDLGSLAGGAYYYQPWDGRNDAGRDVASGVYFAQIKVGGRSKFVKMALIK